jgi:hypothetical protein
MSTSFDLSSLPGGEKGSPQVPISSDSPHQHLKRVAELRTEYQRNTQKESEQRDAMRAQLQQKVAERLAVRKDKIGRD